MCESVYLCVSKCVIVFFVSVVYLSIHWCVYRYGRKGDVWAVGCTMIQMMTGKPPWTDRHLSGLVQLHLLLQSWNQGPPPYTCVFSEQGKKFLQLCFQKNDTLRPTALELLNDPFLIQLDQEEEVKDEVEEMEFSLGCSKSNLKLSVSFPIPPVSLVENSRASLPPTLSQFTAVQVGDMIHALGEKYVCYREVIVSNGISGLVLVGMNIEDIKELLDGLNIKNSVHRKVILARLAPLLTSSPLSSSTSISVSASVSVSASCITGKMFLPHFGILDIHFLQFLCNFYFHPC